MQTYGQQSYQSTPITLILPAYFRRIKENWFNLLILALLLHLLFQKDITIRFQLYDKGVLDAQTTATSYGTPNDPNVATVLPIVAKEQSIPAKTTKSKKQDRRANDFSNLTFVLNPTYARRKGISQSIVNEKLENCKEYVRRYLQEAKHEMREHGIPASITLAQGLLESNAGDSRLSRESNNHFGIKCRSKCRGCTCRNYTDDDIYDMFRVFDQPLDSYREHSKLLTSKRYRHLLKLGRKNYKKWAYGLKKAGYATDKRYAEKLILIIETLDLDRFDG